MGKRLKAACKSGPLLAFGLGGLVGLLIDVPFWLAHQSDELGVLIGAICSLCGGLLVKDPVKKN